MDQLPQLISKDLKVKMNNKGKERDQFEEGSNGCYTSIFHPRPHKGPTDIILLKSRTCAGKNQIFEHVRSFPSYKSDLLLLVLM